VASLPRLFNIEQTLHAACRWGRLFTSFGFDIFRRLEVGSPLSVAHADTFDDSQGQLDSTCRKKLAAISCVTLPRENPRGLNLTIDRENGARLG
jgi:hypothetical protein